MVLIAELGDGRPRDQFHHEVGPARRGFAAIEDVCDVGMVHEGQRLPLRLEPGDHLPGDHLPAVHPWLEDLQRHLAADRLLLFGHEDDTEATLADLLQHLVGPDHRAGTLAERLVVDQRQQLAGGRWVALLDGTQDAGHLGHGPSPAVVDVAP
jgi:hypothetical protein